MTKQLHEGDAFGSVRIRYVDRSGAAHDIDANVGDTLMSVATRHFVSGIDGDCGGNCACGTCRIRLDLRIAQRLRAPDDAERELLAFLGSSEDGFRLGCQVPITRDLDGTTIAVAGPDC